MDKKRFGKLALTVAIAVLGSVGSEFAPDIAEAVMKSAAKKNPIDPDIQDSQEDSTPNEEQ